MPVPWSHHDNQSYMSGVDDVRVSKSISWDAVILLPLTVITSLEGIHFFFVPLPFPFLASYSRPAAPLPFLLPSFHPPPPHHPFSLLLTHKSNALLLRLSFSHLESNVLYYLCSFFFNRFVFLIWNGKKQLDDNSRAEDIMHVILLTAYWHFLISMTGETDSNFFYFLIALISTCVYDYEV